MTPLGDVEGYTVSKASESDNTFTLEHDSARVTRVPAPRPAPTRAAAAPTHLVVTGAISN